MNRQQSKTLAALFTKPTVGNLNFTAIESLVIALGGEVKEGEGSRVALRMGDAVMHTHRPHPGKEAKKYQVEEAREFLRRAGVEP